MALSVDTANSIMKEIWLSGPMKASTDLFPTLHTYKCPDCYTSYVEAYSLYVHLTDSHHWLTSDALAWTQKQLKEKLTEKKPKEAHMPDTTTLTISANKLGEAKKQRDNLRNRYRDDIRKFSEKYGCTQFEAAHAIMDTVLKDVDQYATNYSKPAMTNTLAQTLLTYTDNMIKGVAEPVAVAAPQPAAVSSWGILKKAKASNLVPKQGKPGSLEKLDKDVTESDISGEIVFYTKKYQEANDKLKELKALEQEDAYYVKGYGYVYSNNTLLPGEYGSFSVIVKIRKSSPYVSAAMFKTFDLKVPSHHFKFRKLKNKTIYKLQQYSGFELQPIKSTGWTGSIYAMHPGNDPAPWE